MPELMLIVDEAGLIECISPVAADVFGYSVEALVGQPTERILEMPDRTTMTKPPFIRLTASSHPILNGIHRDGTIFPLRLTQHDIQGSRGKHIVMVLHRSIADLPDDRVFLRHRDLYELATTQGRISVWEVDYRTNNFEFSPVFGRILGIPEDQVPTTVDGWRAYFHPDDWQAIERESGRMLTKEINEISLTSRMKHTNGKTLWVLVRGQAIFDADGVPIRSMGTVVDITDRRDAEFERDLFFTLSLDMLCVANLESKFLRLNPSFCKTLGYTHEEMEGRSYFDFVHEDDKAATLEVTMGLRDGTDVTRFENRYRCKDGTYKWLSWKCPAPEAGSDKLYAVARDVTKEKHDKDKLEKALADADQANRAKSEFLSRMSHELRTPLNAILGFGQLLQRENFTPRQRSWIELMVKGGRHLLSLIDEVLDITRIEAGKLDTSPEPVAVADLTHEVVNLTQTLAAERGVYITIDDSSMHDAWVHADRQRLRQVLLNLVSNSIKYNTARGQVLLSAERLDNERVRIHVKDTGPGIPVDKQPRLFTPFDRLGAEATAIEGSGLGLALSRRLAEFMNGTLTFASAEGIGTTFTLELPASKRVVPDTQHLPGSDGDPNAETTRDFLLLYIEDNIANVQLIEAVLGFRPGIQLMTAVQGGIGLELARKHVPNLILLDVHLPDMRGSEVLAALQADPMLQHIPVVVISADATKHQIGLLHDAGACEYLTKPIDVDQFLRLIDGFRTKVS